MSEQSLLTCQGVNRSFTEGDHSVNVLTDLNMQVNRGEQVAILGSSGSGKSTLLHILGTLDKPDSGQVLFEGKDIHQLNAQQQGQFRNQKLGFIYQFHHLLPEFSALENVAMPLLIAGTNTSEVKQRASEMLERVGLAHRLTHKPAQLSGGERQRVAIARALVNQPALVLADEPTGNLDQDNSTAIYQLLSELKQQLATSFVVVTHDRSLAAKLDRVVELNQGQLV